MNKKEVASLNEHLPKDFEILLNQDDEFISEEDILKELENRVIWAMHYNSGVFYQLMYKLDIDEKKLVHAMQSASNLPREIATIILSRQIQRLQDKTKYKPTKSDDQELNW
jgi:hypothetical protein